MIGGVDLRDAKFRWRREGTRVRGDAQACGEKLVELSTRLKRAPDRPDVLREAERPGSPFRKHVFQDDDETAARRWRLERAGELLRTIEVIAIRDGDSAEKKAGIDVVEIGVPVVQYVDGAGYRMFQDIMTDSDLKAQALQTILLGLEQWKTKLERFQELSRAFKKIITKTKALLRKEEAKAAKKKRK